MYYIIFETNFEVYFINHIKKSEPSILDSLLIFTAVSMYQKLYAICKIRDVL